MSKSWPYEQTIPSQGTKAARTHNKNQGIHTLLSGLKQCSKRQDLQLGKKLHLNAVEAGCHTNKYITNALINMYSKCGRMQDAREVFENTLYKDAVLWSTLILGYVQNGDSSVAMELFTRIDCEPDTYMLVAALKACTGLVHETEMDRQFCLEKGMAIHRQAREQGLDTDIFVATNLVDMYSKLGCMPRAQDSFDQMPCKDVVSWNTLILGYVENGESLAALEMYKDMDCEPDAVTFVAAVKACTSLAAERECYIDFCLRKGTEIHRRARELGYERDLIVTTSLIDMYSKCRRMNRARDVFEGMVYRDAVSWTNLILGYVENGESSVAMELFDKMDCARDSVAFVAGLKACTSLAGEKREFCLRKGTCIDRQAGERGFHKDMFVAANLVEMYSKCGNMHRAREVFGDHRNVLRWTSLILGYVENGEGWVAIDLFISMVCEPNCVTYMAAVKACASVGAVVIGQAVHAQICRLGLEREYMVESAVVDLYGKCSSICVAQHVFSTIHSPDVVLWNALIAGYTAIGETHRVFELQKQMVQEGVYMDRVTFMLVLTACSHAGMVEEGNKQFNLMIKCGINPTVDHYTCVVDMLGRANRLHEALWIIKSVPVEVNSALWKSLLGACKNWNNLEVAKVAFDALLSCNRDDDAVYVLMGDICKQVGMQQDLHKLQARRKENSRR